jgi:hypothetical protein
MPDRKTYMRSYMRHRRALATASATEQAEERLREIIRQEMEAISKPRYEALEALIQPLVVMFKPPCISPDLLSTITRLRAEGMGWGRVADALNAEGVPTPIGVGQWHGDASSLGIRTRICGGDL